MNIDPNKTYTIHSIALTIGIPPSTLRGARERGEIEAYKGRGPSRGDTWLVKGSEVIRYMDKPKRIFTDEQLVARHNQFLMMPLINKEG